MGSALFGETSSSPIPRRAAEPNICKNLQGLGEPILAMDDLVNSNSAGLTADSEEPEPVNR
jgi:hypothetical protein